MKKWFKRCAFCVFSYNDHDDRCLFAKLMRAARRGETALVLKK